MWTLAVSRADVSDSVLVEADTPAAGDGEAVLRVERVGLTTNNATYAALGDALRYWQFFPAPEAGQGVVPVWGYATVESAAVPGVEVGTRVYGYLPSASHLVVRPVSVDGRGFRDGSGHRADLPGVYNAYAAVTPDPMWSPDTEDLQTLYRPLFTTAFVLADQLLDSGFDGATTVVLSSASSRTSHSTAFLLRGAGARVVGLTSAGNLGHTTGLDTYDEVLPYGSESAVSGPAVHLDVAGNPPVTRALRDALGDGLLREWIVGMASQPTGGGTPPLPDGRTALFFAPDRMRQRIQEWGRHGFEARLADAWRRFLPVAPDRITTEAGAEAFRQAWTALLAGSPSPGLGRTFTF
jgi:NADPH:quinone reductase-like Zn-dependent oxidoreductase